MPEDEIIESFLKAHTPPATAASTPSTACASLSQPSPSIGPVAATTSSCLLKTPDSNRHHSGGRGREHCDDTEVTRREPMHQLLPCSTCGRCFRENRLPVHEGICRARADSCKTRGVFESWRQRRNGPATDTRWWAGEDQPVRKAPGNRELSTTKSSPSLGRPSPPPPAATLSGVRSPTPALKRMEQVQQQLQFPDKRDRSISDCAAADRTKAPGLLPGRVSGPLATRERCSSTPVHALVSDSGSHGPAGLSCSASVGCRLGPATDPDPLGLNGQGAVLAAAACLADSPGAECQISGADSSWGEDSFSRSGRCHGREVTRSRQLCTAASLEDGSGHPGVPLESSGRLLSAPVHKVLACMIEDVAALNQRVDKLLSRRRLVLGDLGRAAGF